MKHIIRFFTLAALTAVLAACSNEDNISSDTPSGARGIPFSATISNGSTATRALSDPDGSGHINAAWAAGEHVALVYEVGGTTVVTDAEVTAVSDGTDGKTAGTATITASLNAGVTQGTDVTLIYPYSMVVTSTTDPNFGKLKADAFKGQDGTLNSGTNSISAKYDLRQGSGKISLATTPATLKENVTMTSQIAIWKLTTQSGGSDLSVSSFSAFANGYTAQATLSPTANVFYLAVPAGTSGLTFLATGVDVSTTYIYNKASVTLAPSTYYQSTVTLTQQTTRTISTSDGEVTLNNGDIVTGTGGASTKLFIANGATVTLNGLTNKSCTSGYAAGIECNGDATIILADGSTNEFTGHWERAAVYVHSDNTLTIRGGGTLIADNTSTSNGGAYGAGIGGSYQNDCGNIVIEGGTITAKGSTGAGIGGGNGHSCGKITIRGGNITSTGRGGTGIGSGNNGSCGVITIMGGTINATGNDNAAGIGSGKSVNGGVINITGGTINATGSAFAAGIGSGEGGEDKSASFGDITIEGSAHVTATGGNYAAGIGSGNTGWNSTETNACGKITISGSAHVTATGGTFAAGIGSGCAQNAVNTCDNITISGSAHVTATSGNYAAGIGSGTANSAVNTCGKITISGMAIVTATGGTYAAGIGSGNGNENSGNPIVSSCGAISITGGTASATGGNNAAGIGSGDNGKYTSINITSGITGVTATRSNNYNNVPIGKGNSDQSSGTITIDGEAISDNMTKGTETLPAFTNLKVVISDGASFTNGTWTITHQ